MTYDLLCFFNQKAAYDMRMSDWSSDVFSSDLQYGSEIIDVRIKRADLPDGTPLQSAFQRMRTAREQEALTIRAQGAKQAQIIRAEADADASRIYAESFGKDPDFYDFYRAMQSYSQTFSPQAKGGASVILSPDHSYLNPFQGQ